jgi:Zn ribbon nucleic-acid-binding protein
MERVNTRKRRIPGTCPASARGADSNQVWEDASIVARKKTDLYLVNPIP